ncbi:MAG TPA: oxygenase MpaB family protein [Candidatus Kapabacteria bacterium]|nr:oxygenase MpaB family protein [Candidatus Kapabacteria bacterium]
MKVSTHTKSILDLDPSRPRDGRSSPIPSATTGTTEPRFEELWPVDYLETFMQRADPLADRIIEALYAEGRADAEKTGDPSNRPRRALQFLNVLINQMAIPDPEVEHPFPSNPDYTLNPESREALRVFLRESRKLPAWADPELIAQAQKLFSDNPIVAYVLLGCISIPVLYTCGRGGIQVLTLTDQLVDKVRRRLIETSMMVLSVMRNGSFTTNSKDSSLTDPLPAGIEAILRVRLLHATTRTVIHEFWKDGVKDRANDTPGEPSKVRKYHGVDADTMWREEWGIPIHQQYLAGTLMTFSYISLYGLTLLGVETSDAEKKAYMHFWNVFGYILGIDESLLLTLDFPRTKRAVYENGKPIHVATGVEMYEAGRVLYTRMMDLNRSQDAEAIQAGRMLTKGMCDYLASVLKRRLKLGRVMNFTYIPHILMTMLLSKDDLDLLGVKTTVVERMFIPLILALFWIRGLFSKALGKPANLIANLLTKVLQKEYLEVYEEIRKQPGVRYPGIPMEFQEKWGLVKTVKN